MSGYCITQSIGRKEGKEEGEREKKKGEKRDNETWPVVMGSQLANQSPHLSLSLSLSHTLLQNRRAVLVRTRCWRLGVSGTASLRDRSSSLPQTVTAHPSLSAVFAPAVLGDG